MTEYIVRNQHGCVVCRTESRIVAEVWRAACGGVIEPVRRQASWAERNEQVAA